MKRVYSLNATSTPPTRPAGLEQGYPRMEAPFTTAGPWWYHMVSEELLSAIVAWGLTPNDEVVNQLGTVVAAIKQALQENDDELALVAANTMPYGALLPWPGPTPPSGYIKANGILLPRSGEAAYPKLTQAVLGGGLMTVTEANWNANPGAYTLGDGSSTLRVPDYRGLTIKGHHDGSNARTTNTTRALGSYEADDVKSHIHQYLDIWYRENGQSGSGYGEPVGFGTGSSSTDNDNGSAQILRNSFATGGPENTVRNASALICIRAY